ncbi:transglycosylase family protein [Streptomyces sp. NPDC000410]|uniref:transglycosylase family protein n=1 Tax=Streptomyces sp. NPDC000410 TaxID=3154254 RepID=UPI00332D235E
MRSGNGRHRRPRQAPALVVAAGVTGSAIAIPLLGAGSASAADATTWDRVADCETGGMWSADFGNGYYGGLQFSQETWEDFGGTEYAARADLASRSQQIAVAEKVFAAQGKEAWPSCAVITGLVPGAKPSVDPADTSGVLPLPKENVKAPSFGEGADAAAAPSAPASDAPSASASPAKPKGKPSDPASTELTESAGPAESVTPAPAAGDTGSGKHRGTPATNEDEAGNSVNERESGRHASRGDTPAREAAATEDDYTVRPGDNLWTIADANKVPGGWSALYGANAEVVGSDPDLILPGQSLDLGLKEKPSPVAAPESKSESKPK